MTSFDYHLNPLFPIKECSSCGALYTTDDCCSEGILGDKMCCDLDKTPDLPQQSPQNCPKCRHPVDGHYYQGFALLQKKFKEDPFTCCVENGILQDSSEPSNENTNVGIALREPFVVNQDPKLPPTLPSFDSTCYFEYGNSFTYDSISNIVHDSPNVFGPPPKIPFYSCEFCGNDARYGHYYTPQVPFVYPELCYNQHFNFPQDFHDFQQQDLCCENCESNVENLVPNPSKSKGEYECDVPACEVFTTFLNILFDADYDFYSSDDQSLFDEDIPKKIYSNPLFDEEINSMKIDPHHFNDESDLIESMLNHDSSIISSSSKIDSLFDEFGGELILLKSIPPGINEIYCDLEEETHFIKRLLYANSSPHPPEEFVSKNSNAAFESFFPSPIPVKDNDSLMEENDLSFTPDDPMPPGVEENDYDSERDILILDELLSNDSLSLPENKSFHFDIP
nr:hypothetical protein [Tanacetum cinerariifolium]